MAALLPAAQVVGRQVRPRGTPSLREMLARASKLGLDVYQTGGDYMVRVPGEETLRINARRKDSTPKLVKLVTKLEEQRA